MSESQLTECALHQDAQQYSHHVFFGVQQVSTSSSQDPHTSIKPANLNIQALR
ncbi:hypothetical protein PCANC_24235 [Puccinia coronata f. sp. avenae]|uniref:Uncharacterized protein n=1 Tax=Puccinia coronata f. sp. avenae TaxID=200324 RepID=A0A2N5SFE6_9BASI|nr:hypothetical protein PCANC_24235 [Puccinia coronata f. sp. avenae]